MKRPSKVRFDSDMNVIDVPQPKSYSKPREITMSSYMQSYLTERNNTFTDPETKAAIAELRVMGVRDAPKVKVVTEAQDKANRASRHEEDNIVSAWGKWFKVEYPNVPYTIDKVAQSRSQLGGVIHKASQYQKGNPDIFIQSPKAGFAGCFIEQKRNDDIFYKDTRILKPGSDNQLIWQSIYHTDLRDQGYWVMFSISLESTKKITERYMAGNPYPMQVFEYYCKPEDYGIFEGNKNFKPIINRS